MPRTLALCLLFAATGATAKAEDWREFLGNDRRASTVETVPTQWSEASNIKWKVELPGRGSSSPIVVGSKVIVTCCDLDKKQRNVIAFAKGSGDQLWKVDFPIDYTEDSYSGYLTEHGYASNTPASDGKSVFVFLGKGGMHALSVDGEKLWSVDVGKDSSNRRWGSGSSVILHDDLVIVSAAEESRTIYALDKATGKERWKQEAGMLELTYSTPRIVTLENGDHELVITVPGEMWGMDASTGKFKWYASTPMTGNVSPSAIVDGDTIYGFGGYRGSGCIAVRAGGKDDVSKSNTIWTNRTSSYVATPLLVDGRFYWIDDRGIAYCTSAEDGSIIYQSRVKGIGGGRPVYASPVAAGGKIYVVTRRSGTYVYEPGDEFNILAHNKINGDETDFNASPAVCEGMLYLRSDQALYCIE
ncbi:MAG: PQQ-like beta-propeller repeat protein [Aureliella sp.]